MNRIDRAFTGLKKEKKKAFISYVTAGDPDLETTEKIVVELQRNGVDIVEIGIPFSDPIADGPVIQKAVQRSLLAGCTVDGVFNMVKNIRRKVSLPIVFMTYYNIVYCRGIKKFIKQAVNCGADGLIVPDLPLEESGELLSLASAEGFKVILLTAPTTPPARFKKIASASQGFLYHVSVVGVTGARGSLSNEIEKDLTTLRKLSKKPLCVGFGVSSPEQASYVARLSDGVIVGSAIISIVEKNLGNKKEIPGKVGLFAGKIATAVHSV